MLKLKQILILFYLSILSTFQAELKDNKSVKKSRFLLDYGYDNSKLYNDNIISSFTGPQNNLIN